VVAVLAAFILFLYCSLDKCIPIIQLVASEERGKTGLFR
jgi:hypothetical protein